MSKTFKVTITNDILGNSTKTMTLEQIKRFNVVAHLLALKCMDDGKEHSSGMWTVSQEEEKRE